MSKARLLLLLPFEFTLEELKIEQLVDPMREAKVMHPELNISVIHHAEFTFVRRDLSGP